MQWQYTPYTIPLILAGVAITIVATFAYRRGQNKPEARTLSFLMATIAFWTLAYAIQISRADLSGILLWAKIKYFGVAFVSFIWLIFSLQYTGKSKWLDHRAIALLLVGPIINLILIWTNDLHHLYWTSASLDNSGSFTVISLPEGIGFWAVVSFSYLMFFSGVALIFMSFVRSHSVYRIQAGAMLAGALAPWVANVVFIAGKSPFPHLDITPFAFILSCGIFAWALFRLRLLDIGPVARDAVIEGMSDAVIVLDPENQIVDLNPAAERLICAALPGVLGQRIDQLLPDWPLDALAPKEHSQNGSEIELGEGGARRIYDLRVSHQRDTKRRVMSKVIVLRDITDRKEIEEELRQSEKRYRTLSEKSLNGIYIRKGMNVLFVNDRLAEIIGYSKDELLGKSILEFVHPEDKEIAKINANERESGTNPGRVRQYRVITKEGKVCWIETYGVLIEYEGNKSVFASLIDITERKRAEEALRREKDFSENLIDSNVDGILAFDREYRYTVWNPSMEGISGISKDKTLGKCAFDVFPFLKETGEDIYFYEALSGKTVEVKDRSYVVPETGRKGFFDAHYSPIINETGEVIGGLGVVRNTTDRKKAEEALQESEEKYRHVIENVNVGILVAQDGRLVFANNAISDVLSYSKEELLSISNPFEFIHPEDQKMVLERHLKRLKGEDVPDAYTFRVVTREGITRWVDVTGVQITWEDKPAILNFFTDVSERIRAEEERKRFDEHIREAQKMDAIGVLAGGIAHEFNNALIGITGSVELLQMTVPYNEKVDKYSNRMKISARRMVDLTNQLLAYARGGKYQPKAISLNRFVKDTLPLIEHGIDSHIIVKTDLGEDIGSMEVDPTQIQMAMTAIVTNAVEAIEGSGEIIISTSNESVDDNVIKEYPDLEMGDYVCLSVKDNGRGMDMETQSRVFEPFFTTKFHGRGLGMAAAYGIVKNHKGAISIESEPGKGTEVRVYLPVVKISLLEEPPTVPAKVSNNAGTILVIEDEDMVMDICQTMLESFGHRVLAARDGKEAINIANTYDGVIDLALLDIKLPDMEGGKIYPIIRESRPNMKVVVCSGYTLDGPAQDILAAGADGFIQKPYSLKTLSEKLSGILNGN